MADHKIGICDDWHGNQGDKVTWTNNTDANCKISQNGSNTWPFRDGSPIPATGSIPPGGTASAHLKNPLSNGTYGYEVDCCKNEVQKTVTVP
jgi:hypothetical protein